MNLLTYKNYTARITFDTDGMVIVGEVLGIKDTLSFHTETAAQVEAMFHQSIDNYLAFCVEVGKEPDKPGTVHEGRTKGRHRCRFPEGMTVKPDGIHPLDPCIYDDKEIHTNVTVYVSQCRECGHVDIKWERQEDTEDILQEPLGPEPEDDY